MRRIDRLSYCAWRSLTNVRWAIATSLEPLRKKRANAEIGLSGPRLWVRSVDWFTIRNRAGRAGDVTGETIENKPPEA